MGIEEKHRYRAGAALPWIGIESKRPVSGMNLGGRMMTSVDTSFKSGHRPFKNSKGGERMSFEYSWGGENAKES